MARKKKKSNPWKNAFIVTQIILASFFLALVLDSLHFNFDEYLQVFSLGEFQGVMKLETWFMIGFGSIISTWFTTFILLRRKQLNGGKRK